MRTYLDHAATTPPRPEATAALHQWLDAANASATHLDGQRARTVVEESRETLAQALGCSPHEVVFTSGGTEADNLAVKGIVWAAARRARETPHVVTTAVEHAAVGESLAWLAARGEARVTVVPPEGDGRVPVEAVLDAVTDDTVLVSVMAANNEVGAVNDMAAIGAALADREVALHTDAVQAFATRAVDVGAWQVDALALSAHKFGGPQGVGVAVLRRGVGVEALTHGGGQERGVRSGTFAVGLIAACAAAVRVAVAERDALADRLARLSGRLAEACTGLDGVVRTGPIDPSWRLASHVHLLIDGVDPAALALELDRAGLAASGGAACGSGAAKASHVLDAMGARGTPLRLSLGWPTTEDEVDRAIDVLTEVIGRLRAGLVLEQVRRLMARVLVRCPAASTARSPPRCCVEAGHEVTGVHLKLARRARRGAGPGPRLLHPRRRAGRPSCRAGARDPVLRLGPVRDVRARGRGAVRGNLRGRPHPEPVRHLQRAGQVRGAARAGAGARLRRAGDRPPRPAAARRRTGLAPRSGRAPAPRRRRSQGPVLRAVHGHSRPARLHPAARRRADQGRGPGACGLARPAGRRQAGLLRRLLHPGRGHRGVPRRRLGPAPGPVVDLDGRRLGSHDGIWRFTVGQRRGLGLPSPPVDGRPRFVVDVDAATATVTVGPREALACTWLEVEAPTWTTGVAPRRPGAGPGPRPRPERPRSVDGGAGPVRVELAEPVHGVALGQAAVVYDAADRVCLGGGRITGAERARAWPVTAGAG
jgi:cysteine desulfurase